MASKKNIFNKKIIGMVVVLGIFLALTSYTLGYLNPVLNLVGKSQIAAVATTTSACPTTGICNVTVTVSGQPVSTVTQGTNVNVSWATSGSVPKIDVLVCVSGGSCYQATNNINVANTNSASNIRVGTNIPIGSTAYIKVRPAGVDLLKAVSGAFVVVAKDVFVIVDDGTLVQASGRINDIAVLKEFYLLNPQASNIYDFLSIFSTFPDLIVEHHIPIHSNAWGIGMDPSSF